jgi:hypothetical protein
MCVWLQYCSQHNSPTVLCRVRGYSTAVSTTVLLYCAVCVATVLQSAQQSYCLAPCAWLQYCSQHNSLTLLHTRGRTKCFYLVWHVVFRALYSLHKTNQTNCSRLSVCLSVPSLQRLIVKRDNAMCLRRLYM